MMRCPECRRIYEDETLNFCLDDGTRLVDISGATDGPSTAFISAHETEPATRRFEPASLSGTPSLNQPHVASKRNSVIAGVIGIIVITALGVGSYLYYGRTASSQIESIAVLPFINESGNTDLDYLSDGMTETLINSLSRLPNLSVKARSSVFRYKGKDINPKALATELHVQSLLMGHVVQHGDQITLNLELIDPDSENVKWGQRYERKISQIVDLQSDIARDVSEKLKERLSGDDQAKVSKKDTADPEAYQLYLKGRFYWSKRTGDSLKQATEYFNKAIEKDPQYALAYSGLAESYSLYNSFNVASGKDSMPQAKAAALKALELDDSIAPAHAALGNYFANYAWNPEASERELKRAIEIDPNYATAYHWLGNITFQTLGRFDESIAAGRRAEELDPLSPIIVADVGQNMFVARRYDEAIPQLKKSLSIEPTFSYAIYFLGACYHAKGMYQEAIAEYRRSLAIDDDTYARGLLVRSLVKAGQRAEAEKELAVLEQTARARYVPSMSLAIAYSSLGRMDDAFAALDKEFDDRPTMFIYMRYDPNYDDLRSDPRFGKLLDRINAAKIE